MMIKSLIFLILALLLGIVLLLIIVSFGARLG